MKKINVIVFIFIAQFLLVLPGLAATNDFTANANFSVSGVTFGSGTVTMKILNESTAESILISGGVFTITNPGSNFYITCADSSVGAIKATRSGAQVAYADNTEPGVSALIIAPGTGVYTITPLATTSGGGATVPPSGGGGGSSTSASQNQNTSDITNTKETAVNQETQNKTQETTAVNNLISTIPGIPATDKNGKVTIEQIAADAKTIIADINKIISEMGMARDKNSENNYKQIIIAKIVTEQGVPSQTREVITHFVTYGTKATKSLGAGERAGVVNSYKSAFSKLPENETDWNDVIKIANGRWPSAKNTASEANATEAFKKIYKKNPDRTNSHDDAAVTVIAYGLRPANRNMNSEKAAIKSFKAIYGYNPTTATAWDIVRAIAYSGATR